MNVAAILKEKGRQVVTISPDASIRDIAAELMQHGVGALVVVNEDNGVIGVISERDIIAAIAAAGEDALDDPVMLHMQVNPPTATEHDAIPAVIRTMTVSRRRHLPVVEGQRLTGLVSIGDVMKRHIRIIEQEHRAMRDYIAQG